MAELSTVPSGCSTTLSLDDVDSSGTQVLSLCNVDLLGLLEEESTCSPFSDSFDLKNGGSLFSEDPNYLWYVKQQADLLRGPSVTTRGTKRRYVSDNDSDVSSTCVMVNIKHDTCVNLCDNPSDMWHGLKMSDGMPVVIRSNRKRPKPSTCKQYRISSAKGVADNEVVSGATCTPTTSQKRSVRSQARTGRIGPVNYDGGFLALQNYVGRGNGASSIYRSKGVGPKTAHSSRRKEIKGRQRQQRVQRQLAEARGVAF